MPQHQPYLVVYPFVKVRPWYFLPEAERQEAMAEHMRIGHEFETINNHTTYSFGIDDQEFMTVFECDEPADFMHLMAKLRESEASRWTERDTPSFVGQLMDIRAALDRLDGSARASRPNSRLAKRPPFEGSTVPQPCPIVSLQGRRGRTEPQAVLTWGETWPQYRPEGHAAAVPSRFAPEGGRNTPALRTPPAQDPLVLQAPAR